MVLWPILYLLLILKKLRSFTGNIEGSDTYRKYIANNLNNIQITFVLFYLR